MRLRDLFALACCLVAAGIFIMWAMLSPTPTGAGTSLPILTWQLCCIAPAFVYGCKANTNALDITDTWRNWRRAGFYAAGVIVTSALAIIVIGIRTNAISVSAALLTLLGGTCTAGIIVAYQHGHSS